MLRIVRNLALLLPVAALLLTAANPIVGTWKMNTAKSKFNPGPAPKSVTITYEQDGEWTISKAEGVSGSGENFSRSNRYKTDGAEYPWDGPLGKGTISIKETDGYHATSTQKVGSGVTTTRSVISKDGKTRTLTITGTDSQGKKVHNTMVFEKQ